MDINSTFESDAQLAHACEPRVRAFHDPTMAPQPVVALDPLASDAWRDAPLLEVMAATVDVVALSACSLPGQRRGRPGLPAMGGKASTSSSKTTESCRLAPVTHNAKGTPLRSTIRCHLLPSLPRSVGFGPLYAPPGGTPHWPRPGWLGSGPACRLAAVRPAGPDAVDARRQRPANRATGANRSYRCRSPIPGAVLPMQCRYAGHRRCR